MNTPTNSPTPGAPQVPREQGAAITMTPAWCGHCDLWQPLFEALSEAATECANAEPTRECAERLRDLAQGWARTLRAASHTEGA